MGLLSALGKEGFKAFRSGEMFGRGAGPNRQRQLMQSRRVLEQQQHWSDLIARVDDELAMLGHGGRY